MFSRFPYNLTRNITVCSSMANNDHFQKLVTADFLGKWIIMVSTIIMAN